MRRSRRRSRESRVARRTFAHVSLVRSDFALLPRFSSRRTRLSRELRVSKLCWPRFGKHLRRRVMETAASEGLLLVDKPAGVTSHDMVLAARRAYHERSIGHLGTLDPFATGLLVMLLGRSTRL